MSSPRRTAFLLGSKESDGRIAYNSRDKEDSLSLKLKRNGYWIFFFLLPHVFFSFVLFLPFAFLFFFPFLFSSSIIFSSFSPFSLHFSPPFWSNHSFGQKEEISSPFPQTKGVAITFPSLFPLYDIITTWLNVSHGIHFPHMANCEPFFQCQVSLSYGAMWHPLTLQCVIRHPTPRKT